MQEQVLFIGVDVSKAELLVCPSAYATQRLTIANEAGSITDWLRQVPAGSYIALESTGRYHGLLVGLAHQAGLRVYVLNARDVFHYAKSLGTRGKTDRVDAGCIARYLAEHYRKLHPWEPPGALCEQVQQLLRRRAQLSAQKSALNQMFEGLACEDVDVQQLHGSFDAVLKAIDRKVEQLIMADEQLAPRYARLQTITGIGPQIGALLTVLLGRFPFRNADALIAYSGLDPRANDSGSRRGARRLSKRGPALLRRQIYLAGFSASRSKALAPLYRSIRAKGLATTEAFLIIGRKLLRAAFAIWKSNEVFDPTRLLPKAA